jgi:hypothetical protein
MGPIEARLRALDPTLGVHDVLWRPCYDDVRVLRGAALSLGFEDPVVKGEPWLSGAIRQGCLPDVLSEAIEAAEALGL